MNTLKRRPNNKGHDWWALQVTFERQALKGQAMKQKAKVRLKVIVA